MKEYNCSYTTRIGKTTFIVNVKQSETAQKPLNTVFQEICKHEVLEDCSADKSSILENHKNHLDKVNPEGTGYRAKTRFARFYNLPELMAMYLRHSPAEQCGKREGLWNAGRASGASVCL